MSRASSRVLSFDRSSCSMHRIVAMSNALFSEIRVVRETVVLIADGHLKSVDNTPYLLVELD